VQLLLLLLTCTLLCILVFAPTSLQAFRKATSEAEASTTLPSYVKVRARLSSKLQGKPKERGKQISTDYLVFFSQRFRHGST